MSISGIPKGLRKIVRTLFTPRFVEFHGTGVFSEIGEPVSGTLRRVVMTRGVMMGDPLTKVLLHLVNLGVRESQLELHESSKLSLMGLAEYPAIPSPDFAV
jgi:hypothetical protein